MLIIYLTELFRPLGGLLRRVGDAQLEMGRAKARARLRAVVANSSIGFASPLQRA